MKQHQRMRFLEKRGDGFYWRRRLPKIRNYQTNLFLTFSLRTDIPSNAKEPRGTPHRADHPCIRLREGMLRFVTGYAETAPD